LCIVNALTCTDGPGEHGVCGDHVSRNARSGFGFPSWINGDELYAGCANEDYKNFLRLHIDHTGLTVYPIGLRRPSNWTFDWDTTTEAPSEPKARGDWAGRAWFRPKSAIEPELIEKPIHIPPRHRSTEASARTTQPT
jgi:hypothetical protein